MAPPIPHLACGARLGPTYSSGGRPFRSQPLKSEAGDSRYGWIICHRERVIVTLMAE